MLGWIEVGFFFEPVRLVQLLADKMKPQYIAGLLLAALVAITGVHGTITYSFPCNPPNGNMENESPILSSASISSMQGSSAQWFLSYTKLYYTLTDWTGNNLKCQVVPIDFGRVPTFMAAIPAGETPFGFAIWLIPRDTPNELNQYAFNTVSSTWELSMRFNFTAEGFYNWKGMAYDNRDIARSRRLYAWTDNRLVAFDLASIEMNFASFDLQALSENFLNNFELSINTVSASQDTLYVGRASPYDDKAPGEIHLFDISGQPKYLSTVFVGTAPRLIKAWNQPWGPALYWLTARDSVNQLWFWDSVKHVGASPTNITAPCRKLAPLFGAEPGTTSALFAVSECYGQSTTSLIEFSAKQTERFFSYQANIGNFGSVSGSSDVLGQQIKYSKTVIALQQQGAPTTFSIVNFGETQLQHKPAASPQKVDTVALQVLPPFCRKAECGPDRSGTQCSGSDKCVYYNLAQTWMCCTRSPFN